MLKQVCPKLPMRDKSATKSYYINQLGFQEVSDYGDYLILKKDAIEIHFFEFKDLNPKENYGMIYIRAERIEDFYNGLIDNGTEIHPNGKLETKPWRQREFSLLDPDFNLITFGESK